MPAKTPTRDTEILPRDDTLVKWCAWMVLHLDLVAATVIIPLIPTYGFSIMTSGVIFALKSFAEFIGNVSFLPTYAADKLGPRPPAVGGMMLIAAGSWLFAVCDNSNERAATLAMLLAARTICGIGGAAAVPAAMKLISLRFSDRPRQREDAIGFAMSGDALGGVTGPIIGSAGFQLGQFCSLSLHWSRALPLLIVCGMGLLAAALGFVAAAPHRAHSKEDLEFGKESFRTPPPSNRPSTSILWMHITGPTGLAALSFGLCAFHIGSLEAVSSFYVQDAFGLGPESSGYLWAIVGASFGITAMAYSRVLRCISVCLKGQVSLENDSMTELGIAKDAWILIPAGSILLVVYPLIAFVDNLVAWSIALLLLGVALGWIYVPSNAFTQAFVLNSPYMGQEVLAQIMGLNQASKNVFFLLGYLIAPAIVHLSHYGAVWIMLSIAGVASGLAGFALAGNSNDAHKLSENTHLTVPTRQYS